MKFKKIVGFGDSWMYGDELLDPNLAAQHADAHPCWVQNTTYREANCFLGLLGQHYDVPTENFGIAGGSLQSTIWNYLWWLRHEPDPQDCLVLVALTTANRHSFYDPGHHSYANDPPWNKYVHSALVHYGSSVTDDWADMVKKHTILTACEQLFDLNYEQSVLFFDGQVSHTAGVLQFNSMSPQKRMQRSSLLWPDLGLQIMFSKLPHRQHLLAPGGHPNVAGHDWIADLLMPEIDRVILRK